MSKISSGKTGVSNSKKKNGNKPKKTSIGTSQNSRPTNKSTRRLKGKTFYRGQGR